MQNRFHTYTRTQGFSLAELLAALVIGSMVLVAVLGVYSQSERAADSITRRLDSSRLPGEILQRIAEDLDRTISAGSNAKITIDNTFQSGFPCAQLTIRKTILDKDNKEQIFEEIIWQTSIDVDSNSIVLYRSHSGMALEDKLLDEKRESWEKDYSFVPICTGVTLFKVQVPQGENLVDSWTTDQLPPGVVVTISFAQPFSTVTGTYDVPDQDKITRTIAIDRTRKIRFEVVPIGSEEKSDVPPSGIPK